MQVWLEYEGQYIGLSRGETIVGRAIACPIRFNDPSVSRTHLKITVHENAVAVQDLDSSNGTWVNEDRLRGECVVTDGDSVRVGERRFRIALADSGAVSGSKDDAQSITQPDLASVQVDRYDHRTAPRATVLPHGEMPTPPYGLPSTEGQRFGTASSLSTLTVHNCPRCGAETPFSEAVCARCGYAWPPNHPSSPTLRIEAADTDRRREARQLVEIPVIYSSDSLTFDGVVRDLSRGGMYIASDLLDPIGTHCQLRVLPDARGHVSFEGVVCHVVQLPTGQDGRPPGLGIQFSRVNMEAEGWLESALSSATLPSDCDGVMSRSR